MTGGDSFGIDVAVGARRRPHRDHGGGGKVLSLAWSGDPDRASGSMSASDARLAWLPQETIVVRSSPPAAHGSMSSWRRVRSSARRSHRVRPLRDGRSRAVRQPDRPLARAPRRHAGLCRDPPARRRRLRNIWRSAPSPAVGVAVASILKIPAKMRPCRRYACARTTASLARSRVRPGTGKPSCGSSRRDGAALRHDLMAVLDGAGCRCRCRGSG